jgi:hypothetical protein
MADQTSRLTQLSSPLCRVPNPLSPLTAPGPDRPTQLTHSHPIADPWASLKTNLN